MVVGVDDFFSLSKISSSNCKKILKWMCKITVSKRIKDYIRSLEKSGLFYIATVGCYKMLKMYTKGGGLNI